MLFRRLDGMRSNEQCSIASGRCAIPFPRILLAFPSRSARIPPGVRLRGGRISAVTAEARLFDPGASPGPLRRPNPSRIPAIKMPALPIGLAL